MNETTCYQCGNELPSGNTFFCSEECHRVFDDAIYPSSTEFRELRITHSVMKEKLKRIIKEMAAEYVGKYPVWEYASALAKAMAEIDWEVEYSCALCRYRGGADDTWWTITTEGLKPGLRQEVQVCDYCHFKMLEPDTELTREQLRELRKADKIIEERGRQMAESMDDLDLSNHSF